MPGDRRQRLARVTHDRLTITGVVVSDKMNKSVVVAARRRAYEEKVRKEYAITRRFMAHDEQNLCREGDRVTIRSCRPMSRWKNHVVVRNYGDKMRIGADMRASALEATVASTVPRPPKAARQAAAESVAETSPGPTQPVET
jgi:small subunit ribosomal protein S17